MTIYPTKFEAYDEIDDLVFSAECFDEGCASVTIKTLVTVESWDEISAAIRECLVAMKLEAGE